MKLEEEIKQKACELATLAFPNENNVWARANVENQMCESACIRMADWTCKMMIDKACEWLKENSGSYWMDDYDLPTDELVKDFEKYMKGE